MDKFQANQLLKDAHVLLHGAEEEANRANEDKVSFLICHHARKSILSFLQGFLAANEYDGNVDLSITELIQECAKYDPAFKDINIRNMVCVSHQDDGEFCLDDDKINGCLMTAKSVRHHITHSPVL
ncbi:MAG: hypothetical protein IPL23_20460 [Saprospiraceae bacterium]|nr:hypothetical protein [Saprospiraceae bacterium]